MDTYDIFNLLDQLDDEDDANNNEGADDEGSSGDDGIKENNTMHLAQADNENEKDGKVELWDTKLIKVKPRDLVWAKLKTTWYPARIVTDKAEYILHKNIELPLLPGYTVVEFIKVPKKKPYTFQIATLKDDNIKPYNANADAGKKQLAITDSFRKKSSDAKKQEQWSTEYISKMEISLSKKYSKSKAKQVQDEILSMARLFLDKALEDDQTPDENDVTNSSHKRKLDNITDFDFSKIIEKSRNKGNQVEDLKAGDFIIYNDKVFKNLKKKTRVVEIVSKNVKKLIIKLENDDVMYGNDLVRKLSLDSKGEPDESTGSSRRIQEYNLIDSKIEYETLERKIMKATAKDKKLLAE